MNTKRMMRWLIVLFLLAALPVMTAVMAQEEEPVTKQLPVVTEPGESQAPATYNVYESEANNTYGTADVMSLNDVMGGRIDYVGDVDNFRYENPHKAAILIDIEAWSIGSALDPRVCLYQEYLGSGRPLACNSDTDTPDSLVYYNLAEGIYYIVVEDQGNNSGGMDHRYELILSSPLLVSAAAAGFRNGGSVAGIQFYSEDILAHSDLNTGDQKWVMLFDGSDVGVTKNVANIARYLPLTGGLQIGFGADQYLPNFGGFPATPNDIVIFNGSRYGPRTEGTFTRSISSTGKIDAYTGGHEWIWEWPNYSYDSQFFSTEQALSVITDDGIKVGRDEDVWELDTCHEDCDGPPSLYVAFDGSRVKGLAREDVVAIDKSGTDSWYLTIQGGANIMGHMVSQKDIFAINWTSPNYTWGGLVWHGPDHGWNYKIDAFEWTGW